MDTKSIEVVSPVVETDIETGSIEVLEVVSPVVDRSIVVGPPVVETDSIEVIEVVSPVVDQPTNDKVEMAPTDVAQVNLVVVTEGVGMLADIDYQPSASAIHGFTPLSPGNTDTGTASVGSGTTLTGVAGLSMTQVPSAGLSLTQGTLDLDPQQNASTISAFAPF
jgi:hypothetical protein